MTAATCFRARRLREWRRSQDDEGALISATEVASLRRQLAKAEAGGAFMLESGDCTQSWKDGGARGVKAELELLLQLSLVLTHATRKRVIKIGRIAGQVATEASAVNREPWRILDRFTHASSPLSLMRELSDDALAELRFEDRWCWPALASADVPIILSICGALDALDGLGRAELFTSRDGLLLPREEALTIQDASAGKPYNAGAHLLWIGDRAPSLDGAQIDYLRQIDNPIGLNVGPSLSPRELAQLVEALNPEQEPGRLTLMTRYGVHQIERQLPAHIAAIRAAGLRALWSCDPIHGNTVPGPRGRKIRDVETIATELELASAIHRAEGSRLGGVHLETTGRNYLAEGDPRLNRTQALALVFRLARTTAPAGVDMQERRHDRARAGDGSQPDLEL